MNPIYAAALWSAGCMAVVLKLADMAGAVLAREHLRRGCRLCGQAPMRPLSRAEKRAARALLADAHMQLTGTNPLDL